MFNIQLNNNDANPKMVRQSKQIGNNKATANQPQ